MSSRERTNMLRAALFLLGAAVIRQVVAVPDPADSPLEGRPSIADSLIEAGDSVADENERRSRPFEPGETIDPNVAGAEDLDRLPGVGASKARRIVEDREQNGPFTRAEDLARVPGLGPKSVERLTPYLKIRAATASSRPAQRNNPRALQTSSVGAAAPGVPVHLNRATEAELQELPGVGPVMAGRIVALRNKRGGFVDPKELMDVQGIGAKTFARLAPWVTTRP